MPSYPRALRIPAIFLYVKFFGCVVNLERSSRVTKKALSCRYAFIPGTRVDPSIRVARGDIPGYK
eukprot:2570839-Rhodomonas_salina.2